mgnify:CR=1 FL=1
MQAPAFIMRHFFAAGVIRQRNAVDRLIHIGRRKILRKELAAHRHQNGLVFGDAGFACAKIAVILHKFNAVVLKLDVSEHIVTGGRSIYTFQLTVTDSAGKTATDTVSVNYQGN